MLEMVAIPMTLPCMVFGSIPLAFLRKFPVEIAPPLPVYLHRVVRGGS